MAKQTRSIIVSTHGPPRPDLFEVRRRWAVDRFGRKRFRVARICGVLAKINCLFWRDSVSPWKLSRLRDRLAICRSVTGCPVPSFVPLGPEAQAAFRRERFTITSWLVSGRPRQLWVTKHSMSTCSFRVESDKRRSEVHRQAFATPISTNGCGCRPPPSASKRCAQAWHPATTGATF